MLTLHYGRLCWPILISRHTALLQMRTNDRQMMRSSRTRRPTKKHDRKTSSDDLDECAAEAAAEEKLESAAPKKSQLSGQD